MAQERGALHEFGSYRLDPEGRVLRRGDQVVPLAPKPFELLKLLVQNPGRAFSKRELMGTLWPGTFVEEANLSFQVSVLRKALGDDGAKWIETVPRYGYRFAADVRPVAPAVPPAGAAAEPSGGAEGVPTARARATWLVGSAILLVLLAAGSLLVLTRPDARRKPAAAAVPVPLTSYPGFEQAPSFSPDGSQVAFTWDGSGENNWDVYVKLVGPGEPLRLTRDPLWDDSPAWSPDGRWIAFQRWTDPGGAATVFVLPALGGAARQVATIEPTGPRFPRRGNLAWTPDGQWIAFGGRPPGASTGLWLAAVEGGSSRRLTEVGRSDLADTRPVFSPDGRQLAFVRYRRNASGAVFVLPLSPAWTPRGEAVQVTPWSWSVQGLAWSPDGRSLVFSSGGHVGFPRLRRVAFPPSRPAEPVTPEVLPFGEHATDVAVSRTGRLVYATDTRDSNLWRVELDGSGSPAARTAIANSTYDEHTPDYSPDGTRLAFASNRSGEEEIWIADADGSNPVQMTTMGGPLCANPRWSPDGSRILFTSRREGSQDLYLLVPDTREVRRITDDPGEEAEPRWSRDGRSIYFGSNRSGRLEVWRMPADGGTAIQVTRTGGLTATESADGRLLYYGKRPGWPTSIWQVPVGGGEETLVVDGVADQKNFVVARRGLYFLASAVGPRSASLDYLDLAARKRRTLFTLEKRWWFGMAISPDERSLLYAQIDDEGGNLMLVESFEGR